MPVVASRQQQQQQPQEETTTTTVDPFEMFPDDDDDDDRNKKAAAAAAVPSLLPALRDASSGFLQFHAGTERALLAHVRNELPARLSLPGDDKKEEETTTDAAKAAAAARKRNAVLQLVDEFCLSRHWMMHVGPEKGKVLQDFLVEHWKQRRQEGYSKNNDRPFVLVEIGTYCGYSALRMIHTLTQLLEEEDENHGNNKRGFVLFTVDVDPEHQSVAKELLQTAGVDTASCVQFVLLPPSSCTDENNKSGTTLSKMLSERMAQVLLSSSPPNSDEEKPFIDFLFLDHDKARYLDDLMDLERAGLIRGAGKHQTAVAADNVIFHGITSYRDYVQRQASKGTVTTRLVRGTIEYMSDARTRNEPAARERKSLEDGLELTTYLKDP